MSSNNPAGGDKATGHVLGHVYASGDVANLTCKQREAMQMLIDMRRRYPNEPCDGFTISSATWFALGATWPAFINFRTTAALARLGLVTTTHDGGDNGWEITLTETAVEGDAS